MNLIIDVGNSLIKFAVFQEDILLEKKVATAEDALKTFNIISKKYSNINKAIVSSVGKLDNSVIEVIQNEYEVLILDRNTPLPFKNEYHTPHTLGVDRIALACAAVKYYPNRNALVIDAGTCVTYDFVSSENIYYGGAISPGIRLRYTALNNLTANLPLLKTEMPKELIGNSTETSIHSGVVFGILKEIEGVISEYREKYEDLTVILTGGDADFLSKQLKNGIFANSNFLLEGLNFILEYNSH